jgi:hypothetical protein
VEAARRELENPDAAIPRQPQRARGPDEIFVAEQIIGHAVRLKNWENGKLLPEAKEQLAKLAEHDQWWVRRYVAEIMRRHRELRLPEILAKLSRDENVLVSKAAKSAKG